MHPAFLTIYFNKTMTSLWSYTTSTLPSSVLHTPLPQQNNIISIAAETKKNKVKRYYDVRFALRIGYNNNYFTLLAQVFRCCFSCTVRHIDFEQQQHLSFSRNRIKCFNIKLILLTQEYLFKLQISLQVSPFVFNLLSCFIV